MKRVLIAGDSICRGYRYPAMDRLKGKAKFSIISSEEYNDNGAQSGRILRNWDEWVTSAKPDIMHWNAGLHDLKIWRSGKKQGYECKLPRFKENIREVVRRCKAEGIMLIWATITPLREKEEKTATYIRRRMDVKTYNSAALEIMKAEQIPVNDLYKFITEKGRGKCISKDGVHQSKVGNHLLSQKVAEFIERFL